MIRRRNPDEPRVLSFAQEGLWYLHQIAPANSAYNVAFYSHLQGPLDVVLLEKSIHSVVERQEQLRTIFLVREGKPFPFSLKKSRSELKRTDLRHLPADERHVEAQRLIVQESSRAFNLAADALFRPYLLRLAEQEYVFLHVAPHIVFEGGSVEVLYRDLAAFYNGSSPPDLTVEYGDFALWQRAYLRGDQLQRQSEFWKQKLSGAPRMNLPTDFPRPAIHTLRGGRDYFVMPPESLHAAKEFFRNQKTTSFRGFLAVFNALLYCYTGQTDLCICSPFKPRNPVCPDLENVIGYFVNTIVLRTQFSASSTFRELLRTINAVLLEAVEYSDLSFGKVVEAVGPPRDPSRAALAQVNFRAPRQPYPALQLNGIEGGCAEYVDNGAARFDLALEIESSAGEACYFEYCTDLFKNETILQMQRDYENLLRALIATPDRPLREVAAGLRLGLSRQ